MDLNLKDLFVDFMIAKKVSELGFNMPCLGYYDIIDTEYINLTHLKKQVNNDEIYLAPTIDQLINWLEIVHRIKIGKFLATNGSDWYQVKYFTDTHWEDFSTKRLSCLNDAFEESIIFIIDENKK